jgi:hypothetical protein
MKPFNKGIATLIAALFLSFSSSFAQCEYVESIEYFYVNNYESLDQAYADQYLQLLAVSNANNEEVLCLDHFKAKIAVPKGRDLFSKKITKFAKKYSLTEELLEYRSLVIEHDRLTTEVDSLEKQLGFQHDEEKFLIEEITRFSLLNELLDLIIHDAQLGLMKKKCFFIFKYDIDETMSLEEIKRIKKEYLDCQKE